MWRSNSRPIWIGLMVLATVSAGAAAGPPVESAQNIKPLNKIEGEIYAHQRRKIRMQGLAVGERRAELLELGLNPDRLDAEQCALYVRQRLTGVEITSLVANGVAVNPYVWVPSVPGKHPFGFHLATVNYASLDFVQADPRFVRLDSTEFADTRQNDLGGVMINLDDVHNGIGVTPRDGTGVRIAIADSGLDLTHPDIPVPIEAFDVTDGIGLPNWGTDVSNTVIGHGTHVTGTAVGSGLLSGGQYVGGAPGADLLFYKIGNDATSSATGNDMIEAINRAALVSADVFTMSYVGWRTYMDGSSPTEQAVDAAFLSGTVCFFAAGNFAALDVHDSISVEPATTSPTFKMTIDNTNKVSAYTTQQWIRVIWIDDSPFDLNLALTCTNLDAGETLEQAFEGTSLRNTEAKRYLLTPDVAASTLKTYDLSLANDAQSGTTPLVHCYITIGKGKFDSPDPFFTVGGPAQADDAIAVGAWTQRQNWINYLGEAQQFSFLTVDTLAPFSSLGPRVDGWIKPDIVAPGAATISCRDAVFHTQDSLIIDNDGMDLDGSGPANYYVQYGTSMASPLAAGATALLIEAAPDLTPSEVRDALRSTASNADTPDNMVGYGLIDILAAISELPQPCPWDCTQPSDGLVGISDFLLLLAQWGSPGTCDIDGGGVGITDFLALLAAWGPCP